MLKQEHDCAQDISVGENYKTTRPPIPSEAFTTNTIVAEVVSAYSVTSSKHEHYLVGVVVVDSVTVAGILS